MQHEKERQDMNAGDELRISPRKGVLYFRWHYKVRRYAGWFRVTGGRDLLVKRHAPTLLSKPVTICHHDDVIRFVHTRKSDET